MKISVIIPSYNSAGTIAYTLETLGPQVRELDAEILVVDSSDDQQTENLIKKYCTENIRLIKSGIRVMPAKQRNIGASEARGDLLIFLDSDVIPCRDFLVQVKKSYEDGFTAGCGSFSIPDFQRKKSIVVAQYFLQLNEYMPSGKPRKKEFPAGASTFCSKKVFLDAGGYPDLRAAEDVMFGKALNRVTELWFFPKAECAHIFRENKDGFFNNQRLLGEFVAVYRRQTGTMMRIPKNILFIFYPVFISLKLYRIIPRILLSGVKNLLLLIVVMPWFLAGLHYWTIGFIDGMKNEK